MRRITILIVLLIGVFSCAKPYEPSRGMLVAYESSLDSKIWVLEDLTGQVIKIKSGRFRMPIPSLGSNIDLTVRIRKHNGPKAKIDESRYLTDGPDGQNYSRALTQYRKLIEE